MNKISKLLLLAVTALVLCVTVAGNPGPRFRPRVGSRIGIGSSPTYVTLSSKYTQTVSNSTGYVPYFYDGVSVGNFSTTVAPWDEISGMTRGVKSINQGMYWAISDAANSPCVMRAILSNGGNGGLWTLVGSTGADTEGIASATIGGQPYIYIGDTGDNAADRTTVNIYRVKEPTITLSDGNLTGGGVDYETIVCQYPGSPVGEDGDSGRDAESLIVDPDTGDMYVLTKRTTQIQVFRLLHAASYTGTQTFVYLGDMYQLANTENPNSPGNGGRAVAGDISPSGNELIVKNYQDMYLFSRNKATQTIYQALSAAPLRIGGYVGGKNPSCLPNSEPQGESCCFDYAGQHIYTASEYSQNYATGKGYNASLGLYPFMKYQRAPKALTEVSFQEGVSSYAGTSDTYLDLVAPGTDHGADITFIVDWNVTGTDERMGLLKFNLSTIPSDATIVGVDLQLFINTEGSIFRIHKFLEAWTEATTRTSLGHTPAFNDTQIASVADATIGDYTLLVTGAGGIDSIVIKIPIATVQAWVNGTVVNNGWLLYGISAADQHSATGNGFQFRSSEAAATADRPKLTVRYHQ